MMNCAVALAVGGAVAGMTAAIYWLRASLVKRRHFVDGVTTHSGEPIDPDDSDRLWALLVATDKSGRLNAQAAVWTAVSVLINAASTIAGAFHN